MNCSPTHHTPRILALFTQDTAIVFQHHFSYAEQPSPTRLCSCGRRFLTGPVSAVPFLFFLSALEKELGAYREKDIIIYNEFREQCSSKSLAPDRRHRGDIIAVERAKTFVATSSACDAREPLERGCGIKLLNRITPSLPRHHGGQTTAQSAPLGGSGISGSSLLSLVAAVAAL